MRWLDIGLNEVIIYHGRSNELILCCRVKRHLKNAHKVNWPDTRKFIYHSSINCMNFPPRQRFCTFISCELSVFFYWFWILRVWVLILFGGIFDSAKRLYDAVSCNQSASRPKRSFSGNTIMTFLWTLNWKWNANSCFDSNDYTRLRRLVFIK